MRFGKKGSKSQTEKKINIEDVVPSRFYWWVFVCLVVVGFCLFVCLFLFLFWSKAGDLLNIILKLSFGFGQNTNVLIYTHICKSPFFWRYF